MTNFKSKYAAGDRVQFFRSHDKSNVLTGTIVKVHAGDDDLVDIKTDAANGSISRIETVHASDVSGIPPQAQKSGNVPIAPNAAGQRNIGGSADSTDANAKNIRTGQVERDTQAAPTPRTNRIG